jgi:ankyrin repeat protein
MHAQLQASTGNELYNACIAGNLDVVRTSLADSKAADPSFSPPVSTILHAAASKDHVKVVKYCLENGATVNRDVMLTVLINRARETYIHLLESKAVDINYYISWFGDILSNVATRDDFDWAELCLDRGADPNRNPVDDYKSLLAGVAELASVEMAALLIRHGAHVKGSGAIVMAAEEGKMDMVKLLLDQGADINEIGIENPTDPRSKEDMGSALHRAVVAGHEEVVGFLLDRGADVNLTDVMRRTPLALAKTNQNRGTIQLLKERGAH